ncbi:MAG: hypothetical protein P4L40_14610, partial [Terracidiphilus sp.]|nr:hypothetical protein [Terracidiphilus sp.]
LIALRRIVTQLFPSPSPSFTQVFAEEGVSAAALSVSLPLTAVQLSGFVDAVLTTPDAPLLPLLLAIAPMFAASAETEEVLGAALVVLRAQPEHPVAWALVSGCVTVASSAALLPLVQAVVAGPVVDMAVLAPVALTVASLALLPTGSVDASPLFAAACTLLLKGGEGSGDALPWPPLPLAALCAALPLLARRAQKAGSAAASLLPVLTRSYTHARDALAAEADIQVDLPPFANAARTSRMSVLLEATLTHLCLFTQGTSYTPTPAEANLWQAAPLLTYTLPTLRMRAFAVLAAAVKLAPALMFPEGVAALPLPLLSVLQQREREPRVVHGRLLATALALRCVRAYGSSVAAGLADALESGSGGRLRETLDIAATLGVLHGSLSDMPGWGGVSVHAADADSGDSEGDSEEKEEEEGIAEAMSVDGGAAAASSPSSLASVYAPLFSEVLEGALSSILAPLVGGGFSSDTAAIAELSRQLLFKTAEVLPARLMEWWCRLPRWRRVNVEQYVAHNISGPLFRAQLATIQSGSTRDEWEEA